MVLAEIAAGGETGLGYTYSDASVAALIERSLAPVLAGRSAFDIAAANAALWRRVRNLGRSGLAATAISALDARIVGSEGKAPRLSRSCGCSGARAKPSRSTAAAGSPPIRTSACASQLAGWVERDGCRWVKMKIGSEPERDPARVEAARAAIGGAGLFVDANGAYTATQALALAERFAAAARHLVRGAGLVGRSRRAGAGARARPGGHGRRRRRIWL